VVGCYLFVGYCLVVWFGWLGVVVGLFVWMLVVFWLCLLRFDFCLSLLEVWVWFGWFLGWLVVCVVW